jgi:hypothetical protein
MDVVRLPACSYSIFNTFNLWTFPWASVLGLSACRGFSSFGASYPCVGSSLPDLVFFSFSQILINTLLKIFFFFVVLGFELRVFILSHSTGPPLFFL